MESEIIAVKNAGTLEFRKQPDESFEVYHRGKSAGFGYSHLELERLGGGDFEKGIETVVDEVLTIGLKNTLPGDPKLLQERLSQIAE